MESLKRIPLLIAAGAFFLIVAIIMALILFLSGHPYNIYNFYAAILELCLNGLIFNCIFVFFEKGQKARQDKESKEELKNTLAFFVKDFVWWLTVGAVQDMDRLTIKSNDSQHMVSLEDQAVKTLTALKEGKLVPDGMIDPVKRYVSKESIVLKCLLPVASQLGGDYMKTWFNIIRSLDDLAEFKDVKNVHATIKYFLERIVEFTRLK